MNIGELNTLKVSRKSPNGIYLEDDDGDEVLMPNKYLKGDENEGDQIQVFIYNDSEDRLIATTESPKIELNGFALLKVVDVTKYGVFLDWGLEKDLLVPFREQNKKMQLGHQYVVRLILDEDTDRLIASGKIKKFLSNQDLTVKEHEQVDLLVFNQSELGFEVIVNGRHAGLIYKNEIFSPLRIGQKLTGYVKLIREDGKIDISLQPDNKTHLMNSNELILKMLQDNGGILNLSDKSSPEEIYQSLQISKKTFKKSIGALYKQKKILIGSDQISLVK